MKNTILSLIIIALATIASAQAPKGVDFSQAIICPDPNNIPHEVFLILGNNMYATWYDFTPVGIKHSYERVAELLRLNGVLFQDPVINHSLLPSYVTDYTEFADIHVSASVGQAEIDMCWTLTPEWFLMWTVLGEKPHTVTVNLFKGL